MLPVVETVAISPVGNISSPEVTSMLTTVPAIGEVITVSFKFRSASLTASNALFLAASAAVRLIRSSNVSTLSPLLMSS